MLLGFTNLLVAGKTRDRLTRDNHARRVRGGTQQAGFPPLFIGFGYYILRAFSSGTNQRGNPYRKPRNGACSDLP